MEKINLDLLFKSKKSQLNFLYNAVLTYRLQTNSILELFDCEKLLGVSTEEGIFNYFMDKLNACHAPLIFMFNNLHNDQEHQKYEFYKYYQKLIITRMGKKDVFVEYIEDILDNRYYELIKSKKNEYTTDEYKIIAKFQLKYALSSNYIAGVIGKSENGYTSQIKRIFSNDEYFLRDYKELLEYTSYKSLNHIKNREA